MPELRRDYLTEMERSSPAFRRLFLPLYLLTAITLLIGGSVVGFFEAFATTDFGRIVDFVEENRELFRIDDFSDETEWERRGLQLERRLGRGLVDDVQRSNPLTRWALGVVGMWLSLALFLLPVYRRRVGEEISEIVDRRILTLPQIIFWIPWILGVLDLVIKVAIRSGGMQESNPLIDIASFLMFGALVGQFNMTLTIPYVTRGIAERVFTDADRFRFKHGRSFSLAQRVQLLIVSVGLIPILLSVAIPVVFNWWMVEEARSSSTPDILAIALAFAPAAVVGLVSIYFVLAQIGSLISFRKAIQKPLDTLIQRMAAVSHGDFTSRTSVLAGDEIGRLKGHFNRMVEGLEEREKIRDTFGRYVSTEIAEKLMEGGAIDLAGEEIVTTVMFSDIRGFTALSETMPPRELVEFLNEYFGHIVRPITDHNGVVNKFIGDSVMAVFSPVFGVDDHAQAALRAAVGIRAALTEFNASRPDRTIRHGVGIHTGVLIAGTVGAEDRREYTVIGDTVNVASRIESQTKVVETDILLSGETVALLQPEVRAEFSLAETEAVTMRGKTQPTRLFVVGSLAADELDD